MGTLFLGCTGYLQNQLSEAEEHFRAVLSLADYANALTYTHSAIGLALTPARHKVRRTRRRRLRQTPRPTCGSSNSARCLRLSGLCC